MSARRIIGRVLQALLILAGVLLLLLWFVASLGGEINHVYPVVAIILFVLGYFAASIG